MPIDIGQLRDGDLLFPYNGIDLALPGEESTHVVIMSGKDKGGHATHIHQVGAGMTNKLTGTFADRTVPNSLAPQGQPRRRKRVMRCKNEDLAAAAAELAARWNEYFQLEFAANRRDAAALFEGGKSRDEIVKQHRAMFQDGGRFRALKYAARRDGFLCYPNEEGESGQGMFCSMFAVLSYQVAGIADLVKPADGRNPTLRVTDKKMSPKDLDRFEAFLQEQTDGQVPWIDFEMFKMYSAGLKETNPYKLPMNIPDTKYNPRKLKSNEYVPSLMFFDYSQMPSFEHISWPTRITKGMMVDSKIIMPTGLFASLKADPDGWGDMGDLVGEVGPESQASVHDRRTAKLQHQQGVRRDWRQGR